MKIAIVHYTAPPVAGGAEHIIGEHARLMAGAGHTVTIVAGRGRRSAHASFVHLPLLAATHPVQRRLASQLNRGLVPPDFGAVADQIENDLRPILSRHDVTIAHNVATMHFNLPLTVALARQAAVPNGTPVIAWTHDIAAINPLYAAELHEGEPWDHIRRPLRRMHYVTVSQTRLAQLRNAWGSPRPAAPTIAIPNGVDPAEVLRLSPPIARWAGTHRLYERGMVMLLPVRITRRKNIELAIDSAAQLAGVGCDPLLVITGPTVGHHPQRSRAYLQELETRAAHLGITHQVSFVAAELGRRLQNREVFQIYGAADILLFPSESEGFGLPTLEAAIHRLPMALSDLPVFREIAGESASYFPVDAPPETVAAIIQRLTATHQISAKRTVFAHYGWETIYAQHIAPLLAGEIS